jgi:hypothetical protein
MRRNAIVTVAVVIALLALGSQIAIPAYVSSKVEDRLTEKGGSAHVEVHAFPAARLIGGGGDRIEIRGKDLKFDLPTQNNADVFDKLDGFDEVDAQLTDVQTGPFRIAQFGLKRSDGDRNYQLTMQASSTPNEIGQYAGGQIGGPLGDFMSKFAGSGILPFTNDPIPVTIDARVHSNSGRAEVVSASGDVAGLSAGPLAATLASAVADRL